MNTLASLAHRGSAGYMLQLNALRLASRPLQHISNIKGINKNKILMKNDYRKMEVHPERASFCNLFNVLFAR
jgi:hypothetical protein